MTRVRVAPLAALVLVGGLVAVAAANCASPTQIIVDVRADTSLCARMKTGIAVGAEPAIDKANLSVYQDACRVLGTDGQSQVGALTITPSGSNDAEVVIKIIAAVGDHPNPDACGRPDRDGKPDWTNCILARRTTHFTPGETVPLTVLLTSDCVGQYCGDVNECVKGSCLLPEQVQSDGGVALDAQYVDLDAGADSAAPDAGEDACVHCTGPSAVCSGNSCTITCGDNGCTGSNTSCTSPLDCTYLCGNGGDKNCSQIICATTGNCAFDCRGTGQTHCHDIACSGKTCTVQCSNTTSTCLNIALDAGNSVITCEPTGANHPTCRNTVCSGECTRRCGANGFGCAAEDFSSCVGDCEDFEDAAPDSGKGQ